MLDRAAQITLLAEPGARAPVQVLELAGRVVLEPAQQRRAEEMLVAIPAALGVERDDEQVPTLELGQRRGAVLAPGDGVAQRPRQALQHRRAGEELARLGRQAPRDLVPKVVGEEAIADRHAAMTRPRSPVSRSDSATRFSPATQPSVRWCTPAS